MPKAKLDNAYEILLDYGYIKPGVSDREYYQALKQATLDFKEEGNLEYFDIVRVEEKELRKKVVPRVKKTKITGAAFKKGTSQESVENIKPNNTVTDLAVRSQPNVTGADITPETDEPSGEQKQSPFGDALKNILISIAGTTESIKNLLQAQQQGDRDAAQDAAKDKQDASRAGKEKKMESRVFEGMKKMGEKVIAPVKGLWERVWGFLKTLLFSAVVGKLFDWFQNPENQKKVKSIFKFVSDFWPLLLTGFLLFGTGIGSLITGTVAAIAGFIPVLMGFIPALAAFLASPIGLAVLGTAAVLGGGALLYNKLNEGKDGEDGSDGKNAEEVKGMGVLSMNKGGQVPGSGNKDTVPAMLTPGEFVMSKGAVQQYGIDTMEGMNAAAGGTNIPVMMPDKKRKGFPGGGRPYAPTSNAGVVTDPEERKQQEAYMLKFVNEERALQGLKPLTNLTYAPGVELTKMRGPGPRTKETSDTFTDLNRGIETTSTSKTVDGKTTFGASMRQTTEEDRQKFFAENPHAAQLVMLKDQMELDDLGADISASAKMNGGGLVPAFAGGGLVSNSSSNLSNSISNFNGGGLVQAFYNGGLVASGLDFKNKQIKSVPKSPDISPPPSSSGSSVGAKITSLKMDGNNNPINLNQDEAPPEVPDFSATMMRSRDKIKTLGIMV